MHDNTNMNVVILEIKNKHNSSPVTRSVNSLAVIAVLSVFRGRNISERVRPRLVILGNGVALTNKDHPFERYLPLRTLVPNDDSEVESGSSRYLDSPCMRRCLPV